MTYKGPREKEPAMNEHYKTLSKLFDQLARKHTLSTVFNDALTMSICSMHRTNIQSKLLEKDEVNETLYLDIAGKYEKPELLLFSEVLATLMNNTYDHVYSDLLGEYFCNEITRGENGQFFTPEPVCELMTKLQGEQGSIEYKTILDPACGSARTLLSFAKQNPNNLFYGADVSNSCAKMSVLNFFMNGLRGEVAWMNSLSMEFYGAWHINTAGLGIVPIEQEQSRIWTNPPQFEEQVIHIEQLDLF